MLNRRLIRIKVFQALYAMMQDEDLGLKSSIKNLHKSLSGMRDNYYVFISFPLDLAHFIKTEKNPKERKYISNEADEKNYRALVMEELYQTITSNSIVKLRLDKPKHNWSDNRELLQSAYKKVQKTDFFSNYLASDIRKIENQIEYFNNLIDFLINDFEEFDHKMEEIEIRWEDEKVSISKNAHKMLDSIDLSDNTFSAPQLSNNEDEDFQFAEDLLSFAYRNVDSYQELIDSNTPGWDAERIAKTDLIFMILSVTEFLNFPHIPPKVTINEYLELAKKYSTPKSSKFLNGILDKLMKELKKDGKMIKKGRGLVE